MHLNTSMKHIDIFSNYRQSPSINGSLGAVLRCSEYVPHISVKVGAILLGPRVKIHAGVPILKCFQGTVLSVLDLHHSRFVFNKTFSSASTTGVPKNTEETTNLPIFYAVNKASFFWD